ncbi:MAG: ABC transporter permease [Gemmatimonadota bacterium]|jgi:predicted permease
MGEWLSRLLLRLYPASFRRRFGRDVERALAAMAEGGGASGLRLVGDALITLFRAWRDEARAAVGRPGGGRSGAGGDLRYVVRTLVRDPVHAIGTLLTLAVAIGANAAVFSVTHSVLFRTLPYGEPERIVRVIPSPIRFTADGGIGVSRTLAELPWVGRAAAYTEGGAASLVAEGPAVQVRVTQVERAFFGTLGVSLYRGPGFSASGEGGHEVVLSERLWERAFGGDAGVVGREVRLSGESARVVGIAPPDVSYPAGTEAWVTYPVIPALYGDAFGAEVVARLTSAAVLGEARLEHENRVRREWAERGDSLPARLHPELVALRDELAGPVRNALLLLLAASSLVLVLGCVNLAGLALARRGSRAGEIAVRRALGAGTGRLRAMIILESLVVAVAASPAAVAFAFWGRSLLTRMLPPELPGLDSSAIGLPSLLFVAGATVLTGAMIGLVPALHAVSRQATTGVAGRVVSGRRRLHPALVVTQIALAVLLVIGAALLGRSLIRLRAVPLGYDLEGVLTFEVRLPEARYDDADSWRAFATSMNDALVAQAGVTAVGYGTRLPLGEGMGAAFRVWAADRDEATNVPASVARANDGYFAALGVPLLAGAGFPGGADAAVLSRSLATRLFGRSDVIGKRFRMRFSARGEPGLMTVAGVVGDTRIDGFEGDVRDVLYLPFDERPTSWISFVVRTAGDPAAFAPIVRKAVAAIDPAVAPFRVLTTRAAAAHSIATRKALAAVAFAFAAAALFLALLGTWGLVAQAVARRRREMGIRMVVGARAGDLLGMVVAETAALATAGILLGVLGALALTRFLSSMLWGVATTDPPTFFAVAVLVLGAAVTAGAIPARRTGRIDPATTLRAE